ncbi:hypothetical protein GRJ2_002728400 [Grus japonensis]|uniref:Uncharacterized protein n=1 Tax=Grus japonensis TaxID=30415 RepID=A0ABC9XY02_GRUJA
MESLFGVGIAPVRNQQAILDLGLQLSALANATSDSLKLLNDQLQHTSKMTIQNRAVLDLMLLKEKGVCGVLNLSMDDCCVYIPNVSIPLQDQINKMKKVAKDSEAIIAGLGTNWLGKVFDMFGFSLAGWCVGFAWQGFGSGGGGYRDGFCKKLLEASPVSDRTNARWLQDREAVESPSLEIFKTRLDAILWNML